MIPTSSPESTMPALSTWNLDPTRILTRRELTTVLADLTTRATRANTQRNLIIVRLACCCGLRVSEIAGLQLNDVVANVQRLHLRLRRQITKSKRARWRWTMTGRWASYSRSLGTGSIERTDSGPTISSRTELTPSLRAPIRWRRLCTSSCSPS